MYQELYGGLRYEYPKMPPKNKIMNNNLVRTSQKWKRTELPSNWKYMTEEDQMAFAQEEDRKCTEGIWFFNNGVPTYITGDHYHYLNWFKIDGGYPDYRDRDRRWFYHWQLCDENMDCLGQCYGKLRRDGYSFRVDSIILNRARKTFESNYGIVSKTGIDAAEMFRKLVSAFRNYPSFMKPQVKSAESVQKSLVFDTPQKRVTNKTRLVEKEISLETIIDWRNTGENAYDGSKMKLIACDEAGKWEQANVKKWWSIGKTCVTLGRRVIGKAFVGSTVNESEKGGKNFKQIYDESDVTKISAETNNRTISGLWRYFVPAFDGIEGFIDEFGNSVIEDPAEPVMGIDGEWIKEGAKSFYERERKKLYDAGDVIGYYEELRQRPFTEEEMFRDPANENTQFDLDKIYHQISFNDSVGKSPLIRGNFIWKDGIRDSSVMFKEDSNGRWLVSWMPPPEKRNISVLRGGQKAPGNTHDGLFSVDPYDHKYTASNKRSMAASHGIHKMSFDTPSVSMAPISEYWFRPNDPSILYEDMLMQCVFYGWQILGESNKPGCINHFRNRGYEHYLMDRPAFTHTEYSNKNQKEKWIPNTGDADRGIRRMLVEHTQSYVYSHVGINSNGEISNFPFNNTLNDLAKFDVEKWTDFDLTVSFMIGVLGLNDYRPQIRERKPFKLFDVYKTDGTSSILIKNDSK